jgi:hypothetical protein
MSTEQTQRLQRRRRNRLKRGGGDVALVCENAPFGAPDKPRDTRLILWLNNTVKKYLRLNRLRG